MQEPYNVEKLRDTLGTRLLASLLGINVKALRGYLSKPRAIPQEIFLRLGFLIDLVVTLKGGYNKDGIRMWFSRTRVELDGKPPRELLRGDWKPEDDGPASVCDLARKMER